MARPEVISCPGCGVVLPQAPGPTHRYIGASAACWSLYGEVLGSIYGNPDRRRLLQLVVDCYAVQHPGSPGRQAAQSVAIHLMTLCLCVEEGRNPADGPRLHKAMVQRPVFPWLEPPSSRGSLTIHDVAEAGTNEQYESAVWRWARDVWHAWSAHHSTIRVWLSDTRAGSAQS
jgi:hypothetical protein